MEEGNSRKFELPPKYDAVLEDSIYKEWEESGLFNPDVCVRDGVCAPDAEPFSIVLPPPNVTGTLHIGHAAMLVYEDILVRHARMRGKRTLWVPGTDHAAIATQSKVEKLIEKAEGKRRWNLGREEFLERVNAFALESHNTIVGQVRKMGASVDWSREAYTLDGARSHAVRTAFKRMYDLGLIYRGNRVVNWDPKGQTVISDDEIVYEERKAKFYTFRYSKDFPISISTTRPETKVGDTAVAVHPDDVRYAEFIGKEYDTVFCGVPVHVKVIADREVDPAFGTGALGVTPAHSGIDAEMAERHGLPSVQVIDERARMLVGDERLVGKKVTEAREAIVGWLRGEGLLEKEEEITQNVATAERTGGIIEPLPKLQWFIAVNKKFTFAVSHLDGVPAGSEVTLKELMEKAVGGGGIKIIPERFERIYFNWIGNLRDWCVSRQIWFGHRVPVWYRGGEVYTGVETPEGEGWEQDPDTLDTWFSSGLWTFSTLGWPEATSDLKTYHPTTVLETGYDIIFFWVARMIFMTDHFTGRVPFREVYITGLVRDKDGQKMSKSKGNVLDPIDLIDGIALDDLVGKRTSGLMQPQMAAKIEKHTRKEFPDGIPAFGADALRFTFASLATHGRDIKFDLNRCEGYKNFCNKLWNAARFVLMNCEDFTASGKPQPTTNAEHWILHNLSHTLERVEGNYAAYRFDLVSEDLYEFTWNQYCDWFVEQTKSSLQANDASAASARHTLLFVLEALLRALHPLIPFVTEEIWQSIAPKLGLSGDSISTQRHPAHSDFPRNPTAASSNTFLQVAVSQVRSIRSQRSVPPSKRLPLLIVGPQEEADILLKERTNLEFLAQLSSIKLIGADEVPPLSAMSPVGRLELYVPLVGIIDFAAERTRLAKEIARVEGEVRKCEAKLASETFVQNAPAAVVDQERARLADWSAQRDALRAQAERLADA